MPNVEKRQMVSHSASNMFDLVADVEKYPEFVPLCKNLHIRSRKSKGDKEILIADMTVAYNFLRESFTSQVLLDPPSLAIDVQYLEGPFKYLFNTWRFGETEPGYCEVEFKLDYEFRNKMLEMAMGAVFDVAFAQFTTAFIKRADKVYGKKKPPRNSGAVF